MDYEKILLGGIIKTPYSLEKIASKLKPSDFSDTNLSTIYKKILEIYHKKQYFDQFLLEDYFSGDEKLESYIKGILKASKEFDEYELDNYIKVVRDRSLQTKLKKVGASLLDNEAFAGSSIEELIAGASRELFDLADGISKVTQKESVTEQMRVEMETFKGKDLWGYSTGFETLDRLSMGLQKGQTWIVGAYTNVGKSWFTLHLGRQAFKQGARVLFLSTEMVEKRIGWRFVVMETGVPEREILKGNISHEEQEKVNSAIELLNDQGLNIVSGISDPDELIFEIKRHTARNACDVVILDFLQGVSSKDSEYETLSSFITRLQATALSENVALVVASQVNRESVKSKNSEAFGYRGSGSIEQVADIGIDLKTNERNGILTVNVKKNRNFTTGEFDIEVNFARGELSENGQLTGFN